MKESKSVATKPAISNHSPPTESEGEGHFFLKAEHQQEISLTRQNTTAHINNLTLIFEYVKKKHS